MYEKIKAEIERLKDIRKTIESGKHYNEGYCDSLMHLSNYIESLEQEQDVDLEKEYNEQWGEYTHDGLSATIDRVEFEQIAYHFYELGLNSKSDAPKIKGWVAKHKTGDATFFSVKPEKNEELEYWYVPGACITCDLGFGRFSDLKWEDEPIEVELTISRVIK